MSDRLVSYIALFISLSFAGLALAGFNPSPTAWNTTFEANPTATDPVSQADDHIRQTKLELSNRLETELDFGEFDNITTDTGRLLEGAARVFVQNSEPTATGSTSDTCLAEADYDGNRHCDEGRIWVDPDGPDNTGSTADDYTISVCQDDDSDGDCDDWEVIVNPANTVPTNGIILWDNSNSCPSGYTEVTQARGLNLRGADRAGSDGNIPDSAGVNCTGSALGTGCGASGGTDNYNDTLTTDEIPSHNHSYTTYRSSTAGGGTAIDVWFEVGQPADGGSYNVGSTGGGESHLHPFRTVLLCKKS